LRVRAQGRLPQNEQAELNRAERAKGGSVYMASISSIAPGSRVKRISQIGSGKLAFHWIEDENLLETLAHQHLLLDHQPTVAQNLREVVAALERWRSGAPPLDLEADGRLTDTLEQISYHHLLGDNADSVRQALGDVASALGHWTDAGAWTPEGPGEVGVVRDDLGWPGSLLPEPPSASFEGPDFGW
jgi:hypothetical protein